MRISKFIIMLLLFVGIMYVWYSIGVKHTVKADALLKNHVKFSGSIISYNKSRNHSYGVIKIKVIETNRKIFKGSNELGIFPYRIEGDYAEFYGYIPIDIKENQIILLESDEKITKFYENKVPIAETSIFISSDEPNIKYVKEHTSFK